MSPIQIYITENDVSFATNSIIQNRYFKTNISTTILKNGILHNGQLGDNFRACVLPELLTNIGVINPMIHQGKII